MRRLALACLLAFQSCSGQAWTPEGDWDWAMDGAVCADTQVPATGTLTIVLKDGRVTGTLRGCAGSVKSDLDGLALPDGRFTLWLFDSEVVVTKITAPDPGHFLGQVTGLGPRVSMRGVRQ